MEFVDTLEIRTFGRWHILLQEYDEEGKSIFNVSVECEVDETYSQTIDLFESYSLKLATKFFEKLKNNIEKTNKGIK